MTAPKSRTERSASLDAMPSAGAATAGPSRTSGPALPASTRAGGGQGASDEPAWWKPGMSDEDIAIWEAADRCAATAPRIQRGDSVAMDLERVWLEPFRGRLRQGAEGQTTRRPKRPAA